MSEKTVEVPEMNEKMKRVWDEHGGKFLWAQWPGMYPLFYLDADNNVLCADCANGAGYSHEIVDYDAYYEGEPMICDDCSAEIESAYGVPETE